MTSLASVSADTSLYFAQAAGGGASGGGPNMMIMMVLMFVMMYFVLIRPQKLRQKQLELLIKNLKVGDHVVTAGGEHGIIASLKETTVMLKVADNVRIEYERTAIATVKKTDKADDTPAAA